MVAAGIVFAHNALAIGAVAATLVPLLIHLLSRRRPRRQRWAAMHLLQAAYRRSARRARITRWSLLALRILAVLLIGLALARPRAQSQGFAAVLTGEVHHILAVDDGLNMRMTCATGGTRFERARRAALTVLDTLPPDDPVSLVTMASGPHVQLESGRDRRSVRAALSALAATQRTSEPADALNAVDKLLRDEAENEVRAQIYVFSSLPRSVWAPQENAAETATARAANQLMRRAQLHFIACAANDEANLSITRLAARQRRIIAGQPLDIEITLANHSRAAVTDIPLQIDCDATIVAEMRLPALAPGAATTVELTVVPAAPGPIVYTARITPPVGDDLPDDDERMLALEATAATPVLIVEGRSGLQRFDGDGGYLAAALAPQASALAAADYSPKRIASDDLDNEPLADYALVALCNVATLSAPQWARLRSFVAAGGGLLVAAGPAWEIDDYQSNAQPLLPAALVTSNTASSPEEYLRFALPEAGDPVLGAFASVPESGLMRAHVSGRVVLDRPLPAATIHARFTDGAPAIVSAPLGAGRCVLVATSLDMSWTNLPAKGDFVALVQLLADYLCGDSAKDRNLVVGEEYGATLSLLAAAQPVTVSDPQQKTCRARVVQGDGQARLHCNETATTGAYRVTTVERESVFAVNTDPAASDPACAEEKDLRRALTGEFQFRPWKAGGRVLELAGANREIDPLLLWTGVLLLLGEMGLANRFRR